MSLSITNNGHSVQVDFNDSDDRTGKWPLPKPSTNPLWARTMGGAFLGGAACCGSEAKLSLSLAVVRPGALSLSLHKMEQ